MSSRIPPSLKWLINKRARLAGDIAKAEKRAKELHDLKLKEIEVLRQDLSVIDATMRLHDIQIDPNCIRPINGQTGGRLFVLGGLASSIMRVVTQSHPTPISTTEVALILGSKLGIGHTSEEFSSLRASVRYRLKAMCRDGLVSRLHQAKTCKEGSWRLGKSALLKGNQVR